MKTIGLFVLSLVCATLARAQADNLVRSGDFGVLEPWRPNEQLRTRGQVKLLASERGVSLTNPSIDLDGALSQEIPTGGHDWFAYSLRVKGGVMMRASLGLVSLDAKGTVLGIETPTRINGMRWATLEGTVRVPPGTTTLRVQLAVLDGQCSFSDVQIRKTTAPKRPTARTRSAAGAGFGVKAFAVERPFWELLVEDLDGDGKPEIVGCDVDGIVTVRQEGGAPTLRFDAGALVYQFAAADVDGDGVKDILLSSVDPKLAVRAVTLRGVVVRTFAGTDGPQRIAAGDLDGDGKPEIAISVRNNVAGSGVAGGVALFDRSGRKLWEKERTLRNFAFGKWTKGNGSQLVAGGQNFEFTVYDRDGTVLKEFAAKGGLLEQFQLADVDGDGALDVVGLVSAGAQHTLIAHNGTKTIWESPVAIALKASGTAANALIRTGDFDPKTKGLETVVVGMHIVSVFDATGARVYQSRETGGGEYWEMWAPDGINSASIAGWFGAQSGLYLSSSRFRDPAYYRLSYGQPDEFRSFKVPDQEKHLEAIHAAVKQQPAQPTRSGEKIKIFMAGAEYGRVPEATLREYREALRQLETPSLEYLVMFEASDLLGHERGQKMTTDQIVARAALLEKVGIPFGYFATHGGQVWLSREAIRRSKEAAPNMFRFLYIAENLETLYTALYKDVLKWTDDALDFCAEHGMKMIFKEKHDVWGLLPSDPEVFNVLFSPKHREVTVPIWATNQPFQPEIQLGGMLGLKAAGLCREFGMSTQYWNWHEWGKYPRGIRDSSPTYVCPSDIILRLELMGVALGGTWVHIEGGQTYLRPDLRQGVVPLANRHRELVYELIRKNLLTPGAQPANLNTTTLVRSFHPALEEGKARQRKVAYPYYERNIDALRRGFIPARFIFEPYGAEAFPRLAYAEDWNVRTCFPQTPYGWVPVLPAGTPLAKSGVAIQTDGERVRFEGDWLTANEAAPRVTQSLAGGATAIPLQAAGVCLILQEQTADACTALLIDPGYLAPVGVETRLVSAKRSLRRVTDLVTGKTVAVSGNGCPVSIEPGAFRLLRVEFEP